MYYAVLFYPQLEPKLAASIDAIRRLHDPTWRLIEPHVGFCFPATDSLDEHKLAYHLETVLRGRSPFTIQLGEFTKTNDHWLLLTVQRGAGEIRELSQMFYTGYLAPFKKKPGSPGSNPTPHLGLGLFQKPGCRYDYRHPKDSEFDRVRYDQALAMARALPLPFEAEVNKLHITAIPDIVTEWTTGKRDDLPEDAFMKPVRELRLQI